ncbi:hypothetical protein RvY_11807 [Ramazzottius varieornatus]|uniref:Uncharacterized protein n=1 Tax=Ramazzottius varieornatus TaxID=947166 RepID=A0A1D1VHC5_RAMVA|nr:hypothetical protein RvY_11807 [Ramazzottius varieornatus]
MGLLGNGIHPLALSGMVALQSVPHNASHLLHVTSDVAVVPEPFKLLHQIFYRNKLCTENLQNTMDQENLRAPKGSQLGQLSMHRLRS